MSEANMMIKKPVDRRILRTKTAIRDALVFLIGVKGFDAILVSDIAQRANINRGTFYLHYQDKFDLLEKTQNEIAADFERIILKANSLNLAEFNKVDHPLPMLISLFEYLQENAALMHAMFTLEGGTCFQTRVKKVVEKNVKLEALIGLKEKNFLVPSHYLISYALSAHFGVIQDWLERGCSESPREMAIILSKISWFGVVRSTGFVQT
jgi:AcrR family transcriptional regulator